MSFSQLINDPISLLKQFRVISLQAPEYPALFTRVLLEKITRDGEKKPAVINVSATEIGQVTLRLSTSFLGQACLYWLGDTSSLSLKNSAVLAQFLSAYQGEHTVLLYSQQVISGQQAVTVELPEKINFGLMNDLILLYPVVQHKRCQALARDVFNRVEVLTLAQALVILDYASVLGANRELFIDEWLEVLVKPESSLFELSGFLLARDPRFWQNWQRVKSAYEFPFWVSYFSELFFRAHYYGYYRKNNQLIEAKKIGYRLPFSFIQRDWQKLDRELLRVAHDKLNTIDYQLKNGATLEILDSVFVQFFA